MQLKNCYAKKSNSGHLRRIKYFDEQRQATLYFVTNNFQLDAYKITQLYKFRWQVDLFFKWIKQHLRIKFFFARSEPAVKTQIWIAISTYLLVAIMKKELKLDHSLYRILQILSLIPFEKAPIHSVFAYDFLFNASF